MTSYALSLTVVVVDPRRLDLVCRENPRESPRVRNVIEMNMIKTTSLTEEGVPGASLNLNWPQNCSLRLADNWKYSHSKLLGSWEQGIELLGSCRRDWRCFSSINIFNRLILILAEQRQHFMLQNLSLCLEKFGNGLNRRMNVLAGQTRSGDDSRKFTFYSRFLQRSPVNDGIVQAVVVLSTLGFHAQATATKP